MKKKNGNDCYLAKQKVAEKCAYCVDKLHVFLNLHIFVFSPSQSQWNASYWVQLYLLYKHLKLNWIWNRERDILLKCIGISTGATAPQSYTYFDIYFVKHIILHGLFYILLKYIGISRVATKPQLSMCPLFKLDCMNGFIKSKHIKNVSQNFRFLTFTKKFHT